MKLERVIEVLLELHQITFIYCSPDRNNAVKVAIEAVKVIKDVRPTGYGSIDEPLPGETE